jgi:hypothetical protein
MDYLGSTLFLQDSPNRCRVTAYAPSFSMPARLAQSSNNHLCRQQAQLQYRREFNTGVYGGLESELTRVDLRKRVQSNAGGACNEGRIDER